MIGVIDPFATSNSNYGLSGYFSPFVKTYNGFYFTPESEPCNARYLFDKSLHDEEGMPIEYNVATEEEYFAEMEAKKLYDEDFKYEKLEIVEKEESPVVYNYD